MMATRHTSDEPSFRVDQQAPARFPVRDGAAAATAAAFDGILVQPSANR